MTMPSSGALNMGGTSTPVSVAQELGLGLTTTISMNQSNVRTLAAVGGSGTSWSMNSLYGKSNSITGPWVQKTNYSTQATAQTNYNASAYGNGRWALLGGGPNTYTPEVFTSDDNGTSWTRRTLPTGFINVYGIAYGNGTWVIVGAVTGSAHKTLYSTDNMASWNIITLSTSNLGSNFFAFGFGNGYFVTTNGLVSFRSTNGISWTQGTISTSNFVLGLSTDNAGGWISILSTSNQIRYSSDNGATFTAVTVGGTGETVAGFAYGNGKWVATTMNSAGTTVRIYNSTNPSSSWTLVNTYTGSSGSAISAFDSRPIAFTKGTFITGTSFYGSWRSTDGINWTSSSSIGVGSGAPLAVSPTAAMCYGSINTVLLS
jgi:hypothetical protein